MRVGQRGSVHRFESRIVEREREWIIPKSRPNPESGVAKVSNRTDAHLFARLPSPRDLCTDANRIMSPPPHEKRMELDWMDD